MTTTPSGNRPSTKAIDQQHERVESLLETILTRMSQDSKPSQSLVSLLKSLAVHLQTHFEWEESDGYFSSIVQRSPRLSHNIDQLVHEHGLFLEEVEKLVAMANRALTNNEDITDLAERFAELRRKLIAHEHEETKLIQEAYIVDIGTKD